MSDKTLQNKMPAGGNIKSQPVRKTSEVPKIKDYRIIGVIGEGGMGKVYKAVHPTLNREIILKELKIRDRETRERFLREAKVMLDFRHENIVQFYDHFKEGNSHYIAMEYVKGLPLNTLITQCQKIPVPLALYILYQAAIGVHHAHFKGVIHRDIKPHNLLISETGEVKIIDFGIASQKKNESEGLTAPGTVIGTPAYMSPEQFSSTQEITFKSDIYSLGVVFYEMLTGKRPFKNEYSAEVIQGISSGKYPPVSKFIKNPPGIVKKVLTKMFNPKPEKRYKNLLPLIKLLKSYFSKYNQYELKASLACLLANKPDVTCYPFYTRHKELIKKKKRMILTAVLICSIAACTGFFYQSDMHYKLILNNQYGLVSISFNRANLDPSSTFLRIDDKFHKVSFKKGADNYSGTFYLKKGFHEISINSGSYKITRKIDLLPLSVQKLIPEMKKGLNIAIKVYNLTPKEVMLSLRFWDLLNPDKYLFQFDNYTEVNDRLMNEKDNLIVWDPYKKGNSTLKEYIIRRLKLNQSPYYSNQDYAFIVSGFELNGIKYDNRRFKLKFGLDERTVVAHIPLAPVPAKIRVFTSMKKNPVKINNSSRGLLYINDQYQGISYGKLSPVKSAKDSNVFEYAVPPGVMTCRIGNGRGITLDLKSDEVYDIHVKKEKGKIVY